MSVVVTVVVPTATTVVLFPFVIGIVVSVVMIFVGVLWSIMTNRIITIRIKESSFKRCTRNSVVGERVLLKLQHRPDLFKGWERHAVLHICAKGFIVCRKTLKKKEDHAVIRHKGSNTAKVIGQQLYAAAVWLHTGKQIDLGGGK